MLAGVTTYSAESDTNYSLKHCPVNVFSMLSRRPRVAHRTKSVKESYYASRTLPLTVAVSEFSSTFSLAISETHSLFAAGRVDPFNYSVIEYET